MSWFKRKPKVWGLTSVRGHDMEYAPGAGGLVHFSTCWCKQPKPPAEPKVNPGNCHCQPSDCCGGEDL